MVRARCVTQRDKAMIVKAPIEYQPGGGAIGSPR